MAEATLSTLDSLTKNVYLPGLPAFINKRRPILARLRQVTDKKRFRGRKFIFAGLDAHNEASGWLAEGETLPAGGSSTPINMELGMKYHYAVARLSAQVIDATTGDDAAFEEATVTEMNSARDTIAHDIAVNSVYGTGYGDLGRASAYSTPDLDMIVQPTVGGNGTRNLRRNMYISSYAALSGGSANADFKQITAIASTTRATVASASISANDYIFRAVKAGVDPRNKAMMGLAGICDNGTRVTTFQGLTRSSYPSLYANVLGNSGVLRAVTEELIDQLCSESSLNGGGEPPTALYSPLEIQRRMAAYLRGDRQYDMFASKGKVVGGYTAVMWKAPGTDEEIPWFDDRFCRPNEVAAVREKDLFQAIQVDTTTVRDDGSMWRFTDRTDTLECWFRTWRNMGARQVNNCSVLRDVSHTL